MQRIIGQVTYYKNRFYGENLLVLIAGRADINPIIRDYLRQKGVIQEFTKSAIPEQNAHIEAYLSIMESAVCQKFDFESLKDFKQTMARWKKFYKFQRIHGGLGYISPRKFLQLIGVKIDSKWEN